jgi:flagellar M-ring protein FliF
LADGEAIRNLVASAVDGLTPEHVVLLDTDGRQINGKNRESDDREAYEQLLADHILQTLEPVVGAGNVHAAVTVDFDTFSHDTVAEIYDPTSVVTLSMQRSDQTAATIAPPSGVPGTSSNAPNQQVPLFPSQRGENQTGKQEAASYGASKKTQHSVTGAGSVERISAAVIINGHQTSLDETTRTDHQEEWTQEQMKSFVSLSEAAIGYKESRGDSVVVQELSFDSPVLTRRSKIQLMLSQFRVSEPIVKDIFISAVTLAVVFFILKPAVYRLLENQSQNLISSTIAGVQGTGLHPESLRGNSDHLAFDQVSAKIQQDSDQSTRVLQTWIHAE